MNNEIHIYNSLKNQIELFKPIKEGEIGMYVCGPTVYSSSHMGHARSAIVFDVIVRFLRQVGYKVNYVRNFTDIDDKIIDQANKLNSTSTEIANKFKAEYIQDMKNLGCISPDHQPCVSENINEIIELISVIIDKGHAYSANGDVYFDIEKFSDYGKLSNQSTEAMLSNTRIELNPNKKNDLDFALWKNAKPGEPSWESPWGKGRPGWHIECSAMSCKYLGEQFDIHGGGRDLIFPHHENEIAQSECISNKNFANYWIHNGLININKEKMSKSIGNIVNIKDALERWNKNLIRIFFLSHHYRTPVDLSEEKLIEVEKSLKKLSKKITQSKADKSDDFEKAWKKCMSDDFNTAKAFGIFFKYANEGKLSLNNSKNLEEFENVMGISGWRDIISENKNIEINQIEIESIISERNIARERKDWAKADELRSKAEEMGVALIDHGKNTEWTIKNQ